MSKTHYDNSSDPALVLWSLSSGRGIGEASILFHELIHDAQTPAHRGMAKDARTFLEEIGPVMIQQVAAVSLISSVTDWVGAEGLRMFLFSTVGILGAIRGAKRINNSKQLGRSGVLDEVQAFLGESDIGKGEEYSYAHMVGRLEGYGFKGHEAVDQVIAAVRGIRQLRAIGMGHREIGAIVGSSRWNEKTSTFDDLDRAVEQAADNRGIDSVQLDGLVDAYNIGRDILLLQLQKIAREELARLGEKSVVSQDEGSSMDFEGLIDQFGARRLLDGSHFGGNFASWKEQRQDGAKFITKPGKILDYGCANGFLLACYEEWSGVPLEKFGIDADPVAIDAAREFMGDTSRDHFFGPHDDFSRVPERFDYAFWNVWDDAEFDDPTKREILDKLLLRTKGGRTILGFYHPDPAVNARKLAWLSGHGYAVLETKTSSNGHIFVAIDVPSDVSSLPSV